MGICPKLQNKRKTETGDPSFRAWEERGQWITLSWHSVGTCPALGVDSMYLCFMCSGSFQSTLEKLQEGSFCLLSWAVHSPHQLLLIICLKTCQTDVRRERFPILFAKGFYFQIKYKAAAPEHQSSFLREVWVFELKLAVLYLELSFSLSFVPFCYLPLDVGCWTVSEMGRLIRQSVSPHRCGTEEPANVRVLRPRGTLALPYSPPYCSLNYTASLRNFDFCGPVFLPSKMKTVSLLFTWDAIVLT